MKGSQKSWDFKGVSGGERVISRDLFISFLIGIF